MPSVPQELVQQVENFQTENSEMKQMNEKLTQSITALQEARGSQEQHNQEEAHLREQVLKLTSSVEVRNARLQHVVCGARLIIINGFV